MIVKKYYRVERRVILDGDKAEWWQDPHTFPGYMSKKPLSFMDAVERSEQIEGLYNQKTRIILVEINETIISSHKNFKDEPNFYPPEVDKVISEVDRAVTDLNKAAGQAFSFMSNTFFELVETKKK